MILAAAGCLALGWWQWTRYESASGTFQNLGYALQWPFFAGFCVYAYRTFVRLEDRATLANDARGDLFISVHCNSAAGKKHRGIETNTLLDQPGQRGDQLLAALNYLTTQSSVRTRVDSSRTAQVTMMLGMVSG